VAGRTRPELEGLIGLFVNTLALRVDASGGPSFRELVRRVRETALGAYEHQELPFERVVEVLQPERSLSYHPVFQVMFGLQTMARESVRLSDLRVVPLETDTGTTRFDLSLDLQFAGEEIAANLFYSTELFAGDTVDQLGAHYRALLESVIGNPDADVSRTPLASVPLSHAAAVPNRADALAGSPLARHLDIKPEDRVLILGPDREPSLDDIAEAARECGATVLHREEPIGTGASLAGVIRDDAATILVVPSGVLDRLERSRDDRHVELRCIITVGLPLASPRLERIATWTNGLARVRTLFGATGRVIGSSMVSSRGIRDVRPLVRVDSGFAQVHVRDGHGRPAPIGAVGELYVRHARSADGVKSGPPPTDHDVPCGIRARILPTEAIELQSPVDALVEVGGILVDCAEIEAVLGAVDGVRDAAAMLVIEQGRCELVAFIALAAEASLDEHQMTSWLKAQLPEYAEPSEIICVSEVPRDDHGMLLRHSLPRLLAEHRGRHSAPGAGAPQSTTELVLARIWKSVLGVEDVNVHENFFALGGHSILAVRLVAAIEKHLGYRLPLASIFHGATIHDLAELIAHGQHAANSSPLVPINRGGTGAPFFCVHPIGGNVLCYAHLARHLGADQAFYGIRALGLNGECEPIVRFEVMAARYIAEMRTIQPVGPYLLGGYSLGGVIAYEMARQLVAAGDAVAMVALLDSSGVYLHETANHTKPIMRVLRDFLGDAIEAELEGLAPADQMDYAIEQARSNPNVPPFVHTFLQVYRATERGRLLYVVDAYPGRITLLQANEQRQEHRAFHANYWRRVSGSPVDVHDIPGTHQTVLDEPHVAGMADRLRRCIEELQLSTVAIRQEPV
jgi:thioesterase domain-containing protein/acyl carrier protein